MADIDEKVIDTEEQATDTSPPDMSDVQEYELHVAHSERKQAEIEARDRDFLAAMEQVLQKTSIRMEAPPPKREEEPPLEKFALSIVKKGVGVVSLSLTLILMGIVLICCLFSGSPDYLLPVKLSPVAAILLGLELLVHYVTSGKHFRLHIPCIIITALITVGCCFMAVVLDNNYKDTKTDYNNRSIAAEIYDKSYKELRYVADISMLEVVVDLNPDGTGKKQGLEALSSDDRIDISVELGGKYYSPEEFATECKSIIDGYRILGIPVSSFRFENEGRLHSFALDVDGQFMQDYSSDRLTENVYHLYVEDYDYIDDLEDFDYVTEESETIEE